MIQPMPRNKLTREEKENLYEKYGKPPLRDEPLDVEMHNFVVVCDIGGPLYSVEKGRLVRFYDSREEAMEGHGGMGGHDGAIAGDDGLDGRYVNVRTGPATMEYCRVPIEAVLEIVAPGCEWVGGEGYQPRDVRRDFFGNDLDDR